MSKKGQLKAATPAVRPPRPDAWGPMLAATAHRNRRVQATPLPAGGLRLKLERRKPGWVVPPISWVIRPRTHLELELDALGARVWHACDSAYSVGQVVREFAAAERLTFHEARVSVTQYLRVLIQKGAVAIELPGAASATPGGQP